MVKPLMEVCRSVQRIKYLIFFFNDTGFIIYLDFLKKKGEWPMKWFQIFYVKMRSQLIV